MPRKRPSLEAQRATYQRRDIRARARGFTGYGQERGAKIKIAREYTQLAEKGIGTGAPPPGSEIQSTLLRAKAIIMGYSKQTRERADRKGESLLARTKKGRAIREQLRKALGYKDKKWASYYPLMRALYPGGARRK